jgi:isopentenyl-diphosphate delta-isomerase
MRAAIEDPNLASSFDIRKTAPDILLFANLGAVQLNYGYDIDECRKAVEMIGADALILHFNPLQEALQPEGDTNFAGLLKRIESLSKKMKVPLIAKEVGWGISGDTARKLINAGIQVIDVAGAGGTSWSQVEMHRATTPEDATTASVFRDWGIPTATAIQEIHATLPEVPLIASGGIRNGVEVAKCIALGADIVGMAGPFLKAATEDTDHVERIIVRVTKELRVAMFATGSRDLKALRKAKFRAFS